MTRWKARRKEKEIKGGASSQHTGALLVDGPARWLLTLAVVEVRHRHRCRLELLPTPVAMALFIDGQRQQPTRWAINQQRAGMLGASPPFDLFFFAPRLPSCHS